MWSWSWGRTWHLLRLRDEWFYSSWVPLTQQSVLRAWLIATIDALGGHAERAAVLNRVEQDFGHLMTEDDRQAVESRPFEEKWRNRASYERAQMVREGILCDRRDGVWQLT